MAPWQGTYIAPFMYTKTPEKLEPLLLLVLVFRVEKYGLGTFQGRGSVF